MAVSKRHLRRANEFLDISSFVYQTYSVDTPHPLRLALEKLQLGLLDLVNGPSLTYSMSVDIRPGALCFDGYNLARQGWYGKFLYSVWLEKSSRDISPIKARTPLFLLLAPSPSHPRPVRAARERQRSRSLQQPPL